MLFKANDRSFKFFLLALSETEHIEISNLITENGGEICTEGQPPVIIFANFDSYFGMDPVFHINYIRECVRHRQLLDLINFKIGARGYYGCVMSIFVHGENMCSFVEDTSSCCSSTWIEQSKESSRPINVDHIYAQGDVTKVETSNAISWSAMDTSPQDSEFLPRQSPPDSEFLPDRSPPNPGLSPDQAPKASECLPASPLRDSEFAPIGSPPDSAFLPDGSQQNPGLPPGGDSQNSEFLRDGSPQDPQLLPGGDQQNSEFLPAGSPRDSKFPPAGLPQDPELVVALSPPDSEFLPDGSLPKPRFPLDGALQNSAFVLAESPQDPELVDIRTPSDSEFLPDETSRNSELLSARSPRDSEFLPDESLQNPEFLPDEWPRDSAFFPEESQLSTNVVVSDRTEERLPRVENIDSALEIPEPARFEELTFDRNTCEADQSLSEDIIFHGNSPASSSDDITIVHMQLRDRKNAALIPESALPCLNVNELYPLSAAKEKAAACEDLPVSIQQDREISLNTRLERLQTSEPEPADRAIPPILESKNVKRKSPPKKTHVDKLPVAGGLSTAASLTILRDESNQVKILRGIKESLDNMERFRLTSSDSDDTDYNPTTKIFDHERRRSVDQSSSHRAQETDSKKKILRKRRKNSSPLADSNISEDEEVPEVLNDGKKTVGQPKSNKKSDDNSCTSNNWVNISRVANNERNTVVSSTRSSDDVMSISDSDSEPLSGDRVASSSSHRTTRSAIFSKKPKHPSAVSEKAKHPHPLGRKYLLWEQREMIKYLIDNRLISEAKGNRVWKQMIEDGYLTHRTILSLNNHFRRVILPHIHRFPMDRESLRKFQKLLE